MNRLVWLGAACSALSAFAGVRYGAAHGMLVPVAAAVAGGVLLALFARGGRRNAGPDPAATRAEDLPSSAVQSPALPGHAHPIMALAEPAPEVDQGHAETYEVQLKLDLARSYLEMDEAALAIPLLQEILETELAVAVKLDSDALRETR